MSPKTLGLFLADSTLLFGVYTASAQSVSQSNTQMVENYGNKQEAGSGMESPGLAFSGWLFDDSMAKQDTGEPPNPLAAPASKQSDDWEFTLSPYLWMMSIRAEISAGPINSTSEACFTDLLKDMDMGAMLRFEGRRGRWGFYVDGTYVALSDDARARIGPFRLRGLDADLELVQSWVDFGGMYRFGPPARSFDLMLGGRYAYISNDVSVGPLDLDTSDDSLAPVVGGRVELGLSERWLFSTRGDVGGFGIGDAAELTWGLTGLFGYRLTDRTTIGFGYRYYDIEFSGDNLDMQFHGPIAGVSFHF